MGSMYEKYLGPTLREVLKSVTEGKTHQEMLQLYDEISLARATFSQNLKMCSAVMESPTASAEARDLAASAVMTGLKEIGDLCDKMAKIEASLEDKVSARQIAVFVDQICVMIHAALAGNPREAEIAIQLTRDIKTKIRMPSAELKAIRVRTPGSIRNAEQRTGQVDPNTAEAMRKAAMDGSDIVGKSPTDPA